MPESEFEGFDSVEKAQEFYDENPDVAVVKEKLLAETDEEIPPEPEAAQPVPLAERERRKLAAMTPEQKARYDQAQAEIMAHPAVSAFKAEEDRRFSEKKATQEAFLAAYRKKLKEK